MSFQFLWCRKVADPAPKDTTTSLPELKDGDIFNISREALDSVITPDYDRNTFFLCSHLDTVQLVVENKRLCYLIEHYVTKVGRVNSSRAITSGQEAILGLATYVGNKDELAMLLDQSKHVFFNKDDKVYVHSVGKAGGWCIKLGAAPNPALVLEKQHLDALAQDLRKAIETSDANVKLKSVYEQLKKFDAKAIKT